MAGGNNRINTGDINVGNGNWGGGWGDGGWGGWVDHPVAAGVVAGATAAAIAGAYGSVYYDLPVGCPTYPYGGYTYYSCGGVYYEPRYEGTSVTYVTVPPPDSGTASLQ